jgi:hypothetical protein
MTRLAASFMICETELAHQRGDWGEIYSVTFEMVKSPTRLEIVAFIE